MTHSAGSGGALGEKHPRELFPQAQMPQDALDHGPVVDKHDDPHFP